jgi:hypothetical protein
LIILITFGKATAAAQVRARVWSCGICGGQSGAGACFLWVLRFPLPIFIAPVAPQSPSPTIWGLYNRPEVAAVPSGLSPTPLIIIITLGKDLSYEVPHYVVFSSLLSPPCSIQIFSWAPVLRRLHSGLSYYAL